MAAGNRGSGRWTMESINQAKKKATPSSMAVDQFKKHVASTKLETDIQQELMDILELIPFKGRKIKDFIYAVPNGGYRAKRTANILKAEGVKKGVPDLHCFVAKAPYHSLYIEMKTQKGNLTESQEGLIPVLREEGHKVVVCRSKEQAVTEILKYLGIKL